MEEKQIRRKMRINIGSYGWALLIHYFLMNVCVSTAMTLEMIFQMIGSLGTGEIDSQALLGNGWGYLIACLMAVLFIRLWKGKAFFGGMWKAERDMTPGAFFTLVCLFISGQLLFQVFAAILETVLNLFGFSALESMGLATVSTDTISMFLYTSLAAPIVEEIIFRGLVLRGLEGYGKRFAVLASAVLFGLFHGNVVQSPYAFAVGLVLGYTAVEYNIGWAMVLHMINNLLLGDTIPRLTQGLGEFGASLVLQGIILVCSIGATVSLIRKRKEIGAWLRGAPGNRPAWRAFWTAPGILAMVIVMGLSALSMLTR